MSAHALQNLSAKQLRQASILRARIDKLEARLNSLLGGSAPAAPAATGRRRRRFSASTRAKMAAAQRARWAKRKAGK